MRPFSPRVDWNPSANLNAPSGPKAWTTLEFWSPTKTVWPPGLTATACGKRKTPPPCGVSPTTEGDHVAAPASVATAPRAMAVSNPRARSESERIVTQQRSPTRQGRGALFDARPRDRGAAGGHHRPVRLRFVLAALAALTVAGCGGGHATRTVRVGVTPAP